MRHVQRVNVATLRHVGLRQQEALADQRTMSVTSQNTAQGSQNTVLMMCSRWMVNHVTGERHFATRVHVEHTLTNAVCCGVRQARAQTCSATK